MNHLLKAGIFTLFIILSGPVYAQINESEINQKWAFEVNALWPVFPGNIYSARFLYEVYQQEKSSGEVYLGALYRPYEFRENEGNFSNSAILFGYRQFIWKGMNAEWYNAIGPGRIRKSVVNGQDYNSIDYETGFLLGYRIMFFETKRTPLYLNLMPLGFAYVAYQSDPHPILNQTSESAIYFGKIQLGIRF